MLHRARLRRWPLRQAGFGGSRNPATGSGWVSRVRQPGFYRAGCSPSKSPANRAGIRWLEWVSLLANYRAAKLKTMDRPHYSLHKIAFWRGFWRGMAAPVMLFDAPKVEPPPHYDSQPEALPPMPWANRTDVEALRGDWERIGADMWRVIEREKAANRRP